MKKIVCFLLINAILAAQTSTPSLTNKKIEEEILDGKVIWPETYTLEIEKPIAKISDGKTYLSIVLQNLINDELSLQRMVITRGKVIPVSIEYPVHTSHESLPSGEREILLARDSMPDKLPLKILRSAGAPPEKFACSAKLKTDQYIVFSRISGAVGALQLDILLCQGADQIFRETTVAEEQALVPAVNRLMNPLRAKLTGNVYASLKIEATTPRVSVYLDEQFIGKTPLVYSYLIPGKYRLSLKKDGFGSKDETIEVVAAETLRRNVVLENALSGGILDVATQPPGARIYLDADFKGVTPKKIENINLGTYRLHLLHAEKGEKFLSVSFTQKNSTVQVNESLSEFSGARIPGFFGLSYVTWYWLTLGAAAATMGTGIGFYVWRDDAKEDIQARISGKSPSVYTVEDNAFIAERNSQYETRNGYATAAMVGAGALGVLAIYFYVKHLLSADEGMVRMRPAALDERVVLGHTSTVSGQQNLSLTLKF